MRSLSYIKVEVKPDGLPRHASASLMTVTHQPLTKICAYCGQAKPLTEFRRRTGKRSKSQSRRGACRDCRKLRNAEPAAPVLLTAPLSPPEHGPVMVAAAAPAGERPAPKKRRRRSKPRSAQQTPAALPPGPGEAKPSQAAAQPGQAGGAKSAGRTAPAEAKLAWTAEAAAAPAGEGPAPKKRRRRSKRRGAQQTPAALPLGPGEAKPLQAAAEQPGQAGAAKGAGRAAPAGAKLAQAAAAPAQPNAAGPARAAKAKPARSAAAEAKPARTADAKAGRTGDSRRGRPMKSWPKPDPGDVSALVPLPQGTIRMRGVTDKGRRWHQEIDPELAAILVREHAAVVVNRHTIRRLFGNKEFRRYILQRDRYTCYFCGLYGDTIDHLLPRAKGGHTTPVNCVCACNLCNQTKADQDVDEFMGRSRL